MGVAVLAFASCAKDTVTETNNGLAIDFRVATETRATEVNNDNLNAFKVTAISATETTTEGANYFSDVEFTKEAGKSTYSSATPYYWPESGKLNFYAYYPTTLTNVTITKDAKTVSTFTPATTISEQVDFVIGTGTGDKSHQTSGVQLTFNHMLSQIEIQAKNTDINHVIKIAGYKISGVYGTGSLDFAGTSRTWTTSGSANSTYGVVYSTTAESGDSDVITYYPITLSSDPQVVSTSLKTTEGDDGTSTVLNIDDDGKYIADNAMLIPQVLSTTGAKLEVLVNVTSAVATGTGIQIFPAAEKEYDWMEVGISTTWVIGQKYTYVLDMTNCLSQKAIKFTTEFEPWVTGTISDNNLTPTPVTPPATGDGGETGDDGTDA